MKSKQINNQSKQGRSPKRPAPKGPPKAPSANHGQNFEDMLQALWEIKEVENGMVKVPKRVLQDLLHKEDIQSLYDVEETPVASGLFATVKKCTHKETGITYAAKFSSRYRSGGVDYSMEVLHEIAMLSLCNSSSHIVHLRDVFQNRNEIILVLEYAPGGDFQHVLDDDMVPFEEDVVSYMIQVLEALQFLHERSVAHLDIKPQNIVLMGRFPNCEIKLCDLEVARVILEEEEIREIIGTPDYVAPEIISMDPITLASDIWSVGVLAYVLLTGFSPFGGENDQDTLRNITSGILDFPHELFEGVSEAAKDFIKSCLKKDAKDRPSVQECLKSPWLVPASEPPSPSPLMLKIPTPDPPSHRHSPSPRRSCITCRNRTTERKRYLSKSREALFEKVAANSNLRKSLSKSKERLVVDLSLSIGAGNSKSGGGKQGRKKIGHRRSIYDENDTGPSAELPLLPEEDSNESSESTDNKGRKEQQPWRSELAKYASKPSRVAELIGSFDPSRSGRRGSLQMNLEVGGEIKGSKVTEVSVNSVAAGPGNNGVSRELKLQRRKSASAIPPLRLSEHVETKKNTKSGRGESRKKKDGGRKSKSSSPTVAAPSSGSEDASIMEEEDLCRKALLRGLAEGEDNSDRGHSVIVKKGPNINREEETKKKLEALAPKSVENAEGSSKKSRLKESAENDTSPSGSRNLRRKAVEPGKKWEYFEIDHPKAISDKKLQQLKAKYARKSSGKKPAKEGEDEEKKVKKEPSDTKQVKEEDETRPNKCPVVVKESNEESIVKGESPVLRSLRKKPMAPAAEKKEDSSSIPDNAFLEVIVNPLTSVISTKTVSKVSPDQLSNSTKGSTARRRYSSPLFVHSEALGSPQMMSRSRSNSITADLSFLNPVHRMCNGAFSRALEKYSQATNPPEEGPPKEAILRRRSSPVLKTS